MGSIKAVVQQTNVGLNQPIFKLFVRPVGTIPTGGGSGATALGDLTDVVVTTPEVGQVLKWNGTDWVNADEAGGGGGGGSISTLSDVVIDGSLADGDILLWLASAGKWVNSAALTETVDSFNSQIVALQTSKQDVIGYIPEDSANKDQASGYAGLTAFGKIADAQIPDIPIARVTDLQGELDAKTTPVWIDYDVYSGDFSEFRTGTLLFAIVGGTNFAVDQIVNPGVVQARAIVPILNDWEMIPGLPSEFPPSAHDHPIIEVIGLPDALDAKQDALGFTPEDAAQKGVAGGYASLDGGGKVPAAQLPSSGSSSSPILAWVI